MTVVATRKAGETGRPATRGAGGVPASASALPLSPPSKRPHRQPTAPTWVVGPGADDRLRLLQRAQRHAKGASNELHADAVLLRYVGLQLGVGLVGLQGRRGRGGREGG